MAFLRSLPNRPQLQLDLRDIPQAQALATPQTPTPIREVLGLERGKGNGKVPKVYLLQLAICRWAFKYGTLGMFLLGACFSQNLGAS